MSPSARPSTAPPSTSRRRLHVTAIGIRPEVRRGLTARRTADIVAEELRRQIIDGELADGDLLPCQDIPVAQVMSRRDR
jgi:hypothetical protein